MPEFRPHAEGHARQVNIAGDNLGPITIETVQQAPPLHPVVTDTLPRDVATLIGRDHELQRIIDAAGPGRVVSIYTIDGMPGIGKTALATRTAHRLADHFPDGRFFVDLHAHTPGQPVAQPGDVLAGLLTELGIDPGVIPDSFENRRNLWRDRLAGKRVLLVLDDAMGQSQVEPLLPAGQGCLTLITSRRRLVALDGALPLALDTLEPDKAAELFCILAHRAPTGTDRALVAETVRLCGYLPLAIVLLAGRLAHHARWTIAQVAADFAAAQDRLGELDIGERAVYAAFTMSHGNLPPELQRLFRRIGLHPGPDIDAYAAAALDDIPMATVRRRLEALFVDHLLDETAAGRYRMHDLLREYARSLAGDDPAEDRRAAIDRLLDYYQCAGGAADRYLARETRPHPPADDTVSTGKPRLSSHGDALAWIRAERANLLACLDYVASSNQPSRVIGLTSVLSGLLRVDGPWPDAIALHQRAVTAAQRSGDRLGEANALNDLGLVRYWTDDYPGASDLQQQALTIYREIGDRLGEARALTDLGRVRYSTDDYPDATDLQQQALMICREIGHSRGEAEALHCLGRVRYWTGDYPGSADFQQQALTIYREIGDRAGEAEALHCLGRVRYRTGDYPSSADLQQQALTINRDIGDRVGEASALTDLGWVRYWTGDYPGSAELQQQALTIYREIGNPRGEANALHCLGRVHYVTGGYPGSADLQQQVLAIYRDIGDRNGEARALSCLGSVRCVTGDYPGAADLQQQALAIYQDIGDRSGEAGALHCLGSVRCVTCDYPGAADLLGQALAIFRDLGESLGEAEVLNHTGMLLTESGESGKALALYIDALGLARRIQSPLEQAHALEGLARCRIRLGDGKAGLTELRAAVAIYQRIGAAEADAAETYLTALQAAAEPDSGEA
jgi:tetratricopeptide (TPR) repeat protein